MTTCPACTGGQLPDHPGGWLAWQHALPCPLGTAEDATRHADYVRHREITTPPDGQLIPGGYSRPVTPAEATLLTALGHPPTIDTRTHVTTATNSGSVITRRWPDLEDTPQAGE